MKKLLLLIIVSLNMSIITIAQEIDFDDATILTCKSYIICNNKTQACGDLKIFSEPLVIKLSYQGHYIKLRHPHLRHTYNFAKAVRKFETINNKRCSTTIWNASESFETYGVKSNGETDIMKTENIEIITYTIKLTECDNSIVNQLFIIRGNTTIIYNVEYSKDNKI